MLFVCVLPFSSAGTSLNTWRIPGETRSGRRNKSRKRRGLWSFTRREEEQESEKEEKWKGRKKIVIYVPQRLANTHGNADISDHSFWYLTLLWTSLYCSKNSNQHINTSFLLTSWCANWSFPFYKAELNWCAFFFCLVFFFFIFFLSERFHASFMTRHASVIIVQ